VSPEDALHGWQPDPFGRYEDRYFVYGEPTRLVRRSGIESTDPQGSERSPDVVPNEPATSEVTARRGDTSAEPVASAPAPATPPGDTAKRSHKGRLLVAALIVLVLLAGAGGTALLMRGEQSATDRYLGRVAALADVDRKTVNSHRTDLLSRRDDVCGSMLEESARIAYAFRDTPMITAAYQAALELTCPARRVAFDRAWANARAAAV